MILYKPSASHTGWGVIYQQANYDYLTAVETTGLPAHVCAGIMIFTTLPNRPEAINVRLKQGWPPELRSTHNSGHGVFFLLDSTPRPSGCSFIFKT